MNSLRESGAVLLLAAGCSLGLAALVRGQDAAEPPRVPAVSGALYFDAWQLEKEIVVRPLDLQEWIDLGIGPGAMLDAGRRSELGEKVAEFLGGRCGVSSAGVPLEFELDRASFIEPDPNEFRLIEPEAVVAAADVVVSVVFAAPLPMLDDKVELNWDLFPEGTSKVFITAADGRGRRTFRVTPEKPRLALSGRFEDGARDAPEPPPAPEVTTLPIPWLSILLLVAAVAAVAVGAGVLKGGPHRRALGLVVLLLGGGAAAAWKTVAVTVPHPANRTPPITAEASQLIADRLLRGVYHAFNFRDEGEQYDVLSRVAGGETLTDIYLEVRRTLDSRQRDGSRVRVTGLVVEDTVPEALDDRRGFSADCRWEVSGRVGHWGHFHDRTNRYAARLVIEPVAGAWKLTGLKLLSRDREAGDGKR